MRVGTKLVSLAGMVSGKGLSVLCCYTKETSSVSPYKKLVHTTSYQHKVLKNYSSLLFLRLTSTCCLLISIPINELKSSPTFYYIILLIFKKIYINVNACYNLLLLPGYNHLKYLLCLTAII